MNNPLCCNLLTFYYFCTIGYSEPRVLSQGGVVVFGVSGPVIAVSYSTKVIKSKQITTKELSGLVREVLYPIVQK